MDGIGNRGSSYFRAESYPELQGSIALAGPRSSILQHVGQSGVSRQSDISLDYNPYVADQSYSVRRSPFYQMAVQRGRLASKTRLSLMKN